MKCGDGFATICLFAGFQYYHPIPAWIWILAFVGGIALNWKAAGK